MKKNENGYKWRFFRAGGFDQVRLDSGNDLLALEHLDQKLWVALACPIDNVVFDKKTLAFIDTGKENRIRASDLITAVKWTGSMLSNPDDLIRSSDGITIQSINTSTDEGKKLAAAAKNALAALGKEESGCITVQDAETLEKVIYQKINNGDGIITEESAPDDPVLTDVIKKIISACGGITDRSGKQGIDKDKTAKFMDLLRAYDKWHLEFEKDETIRPLGDATLYAADAIIAVKEKIDDFFARCAIADFDHRAAAVLNADETGIQEIGKGIVNSSSEEMSRLPLASVSAAMELPLLRKLNPYWAKKIGEFYNLAVVPIIGKVEKISESQWNTILAKMGPVIEWRKRGPVTEICKIDIKEARGMLLSGVEEKITKLIEADLAEASTIESIVNLEKLARFHRDIYHLCTNFVNFREFYSNGGPAIFQAGTLYLDQRSCHLCIKVDDVSKHSVMAAMAGTYLVYCECRRKGGTEKQNIVAAFTNGDSDNIITGRNGVFYDRNGNDWDATVVKIIENPISVRQAFWLPYKSLVRMIETFVAKRATNAETQSAEKMMKAASTTANVDKIKPEQVPAPKKLDVGVVAAIGVAAGAIGTFAATVFGYIMGIVKLGPLAVIGALIALVLLISGPSLILAYIKLRKRNMGPILDAGGWAINAKARINVPFGSILTEVSSLPPGAQRDIHDPYAEKKSVWPKVFIFALLVYIAYTVLNHMGFISEWTHGRIGIDKTPSVNSILKK